MAGSTLGNNLSIGAPVGGGGGGGGGDSVVGVVDPERLCLALSIKDLKTDILFGFGELGFCVASLSLI